jgi:protein-tyrosine kinase
MSRIREALRKAAEERSAQAAGRTAEDLVEILEGGPLGESAISAQPFLKETALPQLIEGGARKEFDGLIAKCKRVQWHIEPRSSVFVDETRNRAGAERFRTLRSRLYQIAAAQPLRRVLLTSSIPEEGKTFVASNLAQSIIRQSDRRVLLIDADLRASRLHLTLGTHGEPGLSDYLCGTADIPKVLQVGETGNLCFIPGGREVPNPSELLHSDKMKSLLEGMTQLFDWIIVDSPPAIAVHDASLLADMCDGVLFVVRAGATDFELAQKAAAEFEGKNLLGVVLNRVDKSESYGEYYYGYPHTKGEDQ